MQCKDCEYSTTLYCHPWNKHIGRGSILDILGSICLLPDDDDSHGFHAVFQEKTGYGCEMFKRKDGDGKK